MKIELSQLHEYGHLEFLARQLVEGFITGLHKSPYHGFSVEFAEHRLYNPGESTKYIDWKVFAKTDRLYTKQYEEETNLRCQIVIDNSPSMHYPVATNGKLKFSIIASAAIAYLLQKQRDAVGLTAFSDRIEQTTPIRSTRSHLNKIFLIMEELLKQEVRPHGTSIAPILHEIAERNHKRSLIVLFSDMFDSDEDHEDLFRALQHLKHNKHEVLLFHVHDGETEVDFNFDEKPYEFIDLETGEKMKLKPSQVKENYKREIEKFKHEIVLKCAQYKIDLIEADIRGDMNDILRAYMIKRAKMR